MKSGDRKVCFRRSWKLAASKRGLIVLEILFYPSLDQRPKHCFKKVGIMSDARRDGKVEMNLENRTKD